MQLVMQSVMQSERLTPASHQYYPAAIVRIQRESHVWLLQLLDACGDSVRSSLLWCIRLPCAVSSTTNLVYTVLNADLQLSLSI